eukprot:scaffold158078_cov25-Prasinocladus_malaysianus.AAC.1
MLAESAVSAAIYPHHDNTEHRPILICSGHQAALCGGRADDGKESRRRASEGRFGTPQRLLYSIISTLPLWAVHCTALLLSLWHRNSGDM